MSAEFAQGYALVIGVGRDLPTTVDDAKAVTGVLTDPTRCAYPPEQVRLLTGPQATQVHIVDSLRWIVAQADTEDTVIIYFSGHGLEDPLSGLVPYDVDLTNLSGSIIHSAEFNSYLRQIRAHKLLIILDCCHAGGQAEAKALATPQFTLPSPVLDELSRSSGRVVLASSRKDEKSWTARPYSIFTTAFLEGLAGYGAGEQDGFARVLDIALWVGRKVPERSKERQHPLIKVHNLQDNFAVAWYAAGETSPKSLPWTEAPIMPVWAAGNVQQQSWQRQLANYRENLLLIEERMSEYVEFTAIPLQLERSRRTVEAKIQELEAKLGIM